MFKMQAYRGLAASFAVLLSGAALTGCMSPTYGTSKTAGEQLFEDIGSAVTIKPQAGAKIKYNPRPNLVVPGKNQELALAEPQASLASKDNPQWVESPEEVRERLAAEAEDKRDDINYRSPLLTAPRNKQKLSTQQQFEAFRAARADQKGAYTERRYLTDPPTSLRTVNDPNALADLGEPETKKEKERKKKAKAASSGSSWWQPFQ